MGLFAVHNSTERVGTASECDALPVEVVGVHHVVFAFMGGAGEEEAQQLQCL